MNNRKAACEAALVVARFDLINERTPSQDSDLSIQRDTENGVRIDDFSRDVNNQATSRLEARLAVWRRCAKTAAVGYGGSLLFNQLIFDRLREPD